MFDKVDIYPYTKGCHTGKKEIPKRNRNFVYWSNIAQVFAWERLLICLLGFFLGRAILLGELMPFGPAFAVAGLAALPTYGLGAVVGVMAGMFSAAEGVELLCQLTIVISAAVLYRFAPKGLREHYLVPPGLVLAVIIITKTSYLSFVDPVLYNYVSAMFEAFFAGILTYTYFRALPVLVNLGRNGRLSSENILYLLILFAGFIAGTGDLSYWQITLKGLLSRLTILIGALIGGPGMGAAVGAVVGVIPGLAFTAVPAMVGAYSFAGLLAGLCRGFNKIGVALGFVLGNIILCVYMSSYGNMTGVLAETGLAIVVLLLIPVRLMDLFKISVAETAESRVDQPAPLRENRLKELIAGRVQGMAGVFLELSKSFEEVSSAVYPEEEEKGLQDLLNEIGSKVCGDCPLYRTCWEREFYRTYQCLLDMLAEMESSGSITVESLPDYLRTRCTRTKEMVITVSCLFEIYRLKKSLSGRVWKSQNIIADQLKSIYSLMDNLSQELQTSAELSVQNDSKLLNKLNEQGFDLNDIYTTGQPNGYLEVGISMKSCKGQMDCRYKIAPALSDLLGQPYSVVDMDCSNKDGETNCSFKLYPALMYRLEVGVARVGKGGSDISGDSYSVCYLSRGKVALILSDGMGAGEEAAQESSTTIALLEKLLQFGLERESAIKMVNSIMLMRSPEDSFATIDMAVVDLCSGNTEFIKIGAPASFLLRGKRVAPITAGALPAGIIEDIEIITISKNLTVGDVLVMITDGIADSYRGTGEKEDWLVRVLQDTKHLKPQELAELIMKLAQTGSGGDGRIADDMTVLVAKVEKENV
ncbi:stage II sporulation protein E [Desulfolucanica intricata]|uniref:stage II sporulation protein E n=1 Tax=Desulfolucanica intricata TaxID=1285191 RepID=UPI00083658F9|nr:stage II sporulation protein E [Desulfolucanica intricata]